MVNGLKFLTVARAMPASIAIPDAFYLHLIRTSSISYGGQVRCKSDIDRTYIGLDPKLV